MGRYDEGVRQGMRGPILIMLTLGFLWVLWGPLAALTGLCPPSPRACEVTCGVNAGPLPSAVGLSIPGLQGGFPASAAPGVPIVFPPTIEPPPKAVHSA
jgi:hypothetical protein